MANVDHRTHTGKPWSLAFPVVSLLVMLIGLGVSSGGFSTIFTPDDDGGVVSGVLLLAWALLPVVALVVLVARRQSGSSSSRMVLMAGSAVFLVATAFFVIDTLRSDSSTAGLGYLSFPLVQWAILLVTVLVLAVRKFFVSS